MLKWIGGALALLIVLAAVAVSIRVPASRAPAPVAATVRATPAAQTIPSPVSPPVSPQASTASAPITGQGILAPPAQAAPPATPSTATLPAGPWVAIAPARLEPHSGEFRIVSSLIGRIAELPVPLGGFVEPGEVVVRLEDEEARARLAVAETEASVRERARAAEATTPGREDVRRAEDAYFAATRVHANARFEVDFALTARRSGGAVAGEGALAGAVKRLDEARQRLTRDRQLYAAAQVKPGLALPSRLEAAVTAARAEVEIADAALQRTRLRSPITGTVLQLDARLGELATPKAEEVLAVIGNAYLLRARAEVAAADVAKVRRDQRVVLRVAAYPGREFEGKVSAIAPVLTEPRSSPGAGRTGDGEVLVVTIDLAGATPLLPGMRAEVLFRKE